MAPARSPALNFARPRREKPLLHFGCMAMQRSASCRQRGARQGERRRGEAAGVCGAPSVALSGRAPRPPRGAQTRAAVRAARRARTRAARARAAARAARERAQPPQSSLSARRATEGARGAPRWRARSRSATRSTRCAAVRASRASGPCASPPAAARARQARQALASSPMQARSACPRPGGGANLRLLKKMWSLGSAAMAAVKCVTASAYWLALKAALPLFFASRAAALASGVTAGCGAPRQTRPSAARRAAGAERAQARGIASARRAGLRRLSVLFTPPAPRARAPARGRAPRRAGLGAWRAAARGASAERRRGGARGARSRCARALCHRMADAPPSPPSFRSSWGPSW